MPVNMGIIFVIGAVLGWVSVKAFRMSEHLQGLVIACCSSGKAPMTNQRDFSHYYCSSIVIKEGFNLCAFMHIFRQLGHYPFDDCSSNLQRGGQPFWGCQYLQLSWSLLCLIINGGKAMISFLHQLHSKTSNG